MNTPDKVHAGWPTIATERLCPVARERVEMEIRSHYQDAVEDHRAAGMPEMEAMARAVADLGDPNEAGKRFRKSHLTEWDQFLLARIVALCDRGRGRPRELFNCGPLLLLLVFGTLPTEKFPAPLLLRVLTLLSCAGWLSMPVWWPVSRWDLKSFRVLLVVDLAFLLISASFGWLMLWYILGLGGVLLGAIFYAFFAISQFAIVIKVLNRRDLWQEIQPPSSAPSAFDRWFSKRAIRLRKPRT